LLAAVDVNTLEWASITGSATLAERHTLGERVSSLIYENSLLGTVKQRASKRDRVQGNNYEALYEGEELSRLSLQI
jgi:hypothetical protein